MDRKQLGIRVVILILAIFILNYGAMKLFWYYSLWWFDILMHFLGGVWLGLAYVWLFSPGKSSPWSFGKALLAVFIIGVFWEFFEMMVNNLFTENPFDLGDTLSDLFFDLAGGGLAVGYYFKKDKQTS